MAGTAALVPVIASASTSHAKFWQNKANTVACGIEIPTGPKATEVLCSAKGIPAPKHTTSATVIRASFSSPPRGCPGRSV